MIGLIIQVVKIVFRIAVMIKKYQDKKNSAKVAVDGGENVSNLAADTEKITGDVAKEAENLLNGLFD
jgi:hypothetical protein